MVRWLLLYSAGAMRPEQPAALRAPYRHEYETVFARNKEKTMG